MSVDSKLGLDKFFVDEENAHIELVSEIDESTYSMLELLCPAGLYTKSGGKHSFDYAGCLECGTCRVLASGKVVSKWEYPNGGCGVEYRFG